MLKYKSGANKDMISLEWKRPSRSATPCLVCMEYDIRVYIFESIDTTQHDKGLSEMFGSDAKDGAGECIALPKDLYKVLGRLARRRIWNVRCLEHCRHRREFEDVLAS